jgi:hypothetical protein
MTEWRTEVAMKLPKRGLPIEYIIEGTGLSFAEIQPP